MGWRYVARLVSASLVSRCRGSAKLKDAVLHPKMASVNSGTYPHTYKALPLATFDQYLLGPWIAVDLNIPVRKMAEIAPSSTAAPSAEAVIEGTEDVLGIGKDGTTDAVPRGGSSLPRYIVIWKNSSKVAWEGTANHTGSAHHPEHMSYVKRPDGHLPAAKTPHQSITDSMEFNVNREGIPKSETDALFVYYQYKHIGQNGKIIFFEIELLIWSGKAAECKLRSSLKPHEWLSGTSMVVYDGNENDGFYVCHAQQVGEVRAGVR